jgi:uncharacterized membrane protein YfhO
MIKNKNINPPVSGTPISQIDFFEKMGNKGVFLALGLILLVAFFVFKDFILLNKLYLFQDIGSDTVNGAWPFFYNYANYFNKGGLPTWSFEEGMGQNIVGGFLRDPFMIIGYLAGPASMPKIYVFIELLKIVSGGIVFYLFLKQLKVSNFSATIGALLFSFSGFMIIGSCWYVFTYEAFTLAMALLGFELYFQKNKWLVFVLSIALIGISMPFNLYVVGIILLFYIIFRLGQTGQLSFKSFMQLIIRLMVFGLIGLMISAPFLLESALQLVESPRGSGTSSYTDILSSKPMFDLIDKGQFGTFITRLFSSDYIGSGSDFKGWQNFLEAPVSYCGIISLVLMPQIFTSVSKSARKWYIFWLLIWLIPTLFPFFRYAFWLFSGDYYRIFSFCLSLVFIVYGVFALDHILKTKKINLITLGATVLLSIFLLSYNYFKGTQAHVDGTISLFVKASLVIYAALLFFITKNANNTALKYSLLGFICIELIYLSSFSVNRRDAIYTRELSEKVAYNDYSVEAVDYIKKNEKGFYRIDKNYFSSGAIHGSLNDNKIHDYYGTSSYSSFANNNFINFLREYGVISKQNEYESRWAPGLINRPILQSLNNVKYIMAKGYTNPVWHNTHDSVAKFGDVLVLKNKYNLPFGYTYNQYIKQSDFDKLSMNQKDFVSLQACVLKEEDAALASGLKVYNPADTVFNNQFSFEKYKSEVDKLGQNSLNLSNFSDKKFAGQIKADAPEIMYLSFPLDKGWNLKLDGVDAKLMYVNNGMTGVYLTKGDHKVEMDYKLRLFNKGVMLIPIGILLMLGLFIMGKKNVNLIKYTATEN